MIAPWARHLWEMIIIITFLFQVRSAIASEDAEARYEEGIVHFRSGDFEAAATSFRAAFRLRPSWKVLYNLGQSEAAAKQYGLALETFERYLAEGGDEISADRKQRVLSELENLRKMVGALEVNADKGAVIFVDGIERGTAPLVGKLTVSAAVEHTVRANVEGVTVAEHTFKVRGNDTVTVDLFKEVEDAMTAPPDSGEGGKSDSLSMSPEGASQETPKKGLSPLTVSGITITALGGCTLIAALATGLVTWSLDKDLGEECPNGDCPPGEESKITRMENMRLSTNILLISGGAITAIGLPLLMVGLVKGKKGRQSAALTIVPSLNPIFTGLFIERRF